VRIASRLPWKPLLALTEVGIYSLILLGVSSCSKPLMQNELAGQQLYTAQCSQCHEGNPPGLIKAPPKLHDLFSHAMLPDGSTPATDAALRQIIVYGKRTMPAFNGRLDDEQVADLIAYLHRK
jgi:mono/diheme cytochrome c family protein